MNGRLNGLKPLWTLWFGCKL